MKYEEIIALREAIKTRYSDRDLSHPKKGIPFSDVIKSITGFNKFVTVFDYIESEFVFHQHIKEYTGYTDEEFSISAINNGEDSLYKIIHPQDIAHKLRYDYIVLFHLMDGTKKIPSLKDNYEINMRIVTKDGQIKKVNRQSYFFEMNEDGIPISQLDIWKIIPNESPYVTVGLNYSLDSKVYDVFYTKNREILDFDISKRQIEIVRLREQRLDNKSVAERLCISLKTVENHITKLKENLVSFCEKEKIKAPIYNMADMIHVIKLYGLVSFYQ